MDTISNFGDLVTYGALRVYLPHTIAFVVIGYVIAALAAYFIGSVNTSIIASSVFFKKEIREHGSNNAGLTNMLRVNGAKGAAITLAGDVLKTFAAVFIGMLLMGWPGGYVAGFFTMIGHMFPVYFGFKGGKGVLCAAAAILLLDPLTFALLLVVFIIIVAVTKYVSAASLTVAFLLPLVTFAFHRLTPQVTVICTTILMCVFIIAAHKKNIRRLLDGEENKLDLRSKKKKAADGEEAAEQPLNAENKNKKGGKNAPGKRSGSLLDDDPDETGENSVSGSGSDTDAKG